MNSTGGSGTSTGTGGTSTATGGTGTTSTGGTTATNTGGTTTTSTGGTTTTSTGGTTTTSTGGTGPTAGQSSGGTTSTGGTATAGGGATSQAGAATAGALGGCSDGCAQLSVPLTKFTESTTDSTGAVVQTSYAQQFEIYFPGDPGDVDLTGATITVRIRKIAGKAGGFQIFAKGSATTSYASAYSDPWFSLSTDITTEWKDLTLNFDTAVAKDATFDPTRVHIIALQLSSGGPWYTDDTKMTVDFTALINPTVVQIDSVTVSGAATAPPGPYTFTANAADIKNGTYKPIEGSTVTWVGP